MQDFAYLQPYIPVLIVLGLGMITGVVLLLISSLAGPRSHNKAKDEPYECGNKPIGEANVRIPVKFYLVALLFLLFDMETIFIIAWATAFRAPGVNQFYAFGVMLFFMAILVVGFLYEWRKGALEWH